MQKIQLSIPEPCHESWQQMTPTEQGRFCNACAKEVIDFSTMTDLQVLNYFTNLTHEKVCGRALPEQLDRTLSRPEPPKKRLFWYWNYFVMFLMFFGKGNSAKAQAIAKPMTEVNPVKNTGIKGEMNAVESIKNQGSRVISGKVTDKDGNPVSFASIRVKGTPTGAAADANGAYSLKVNSNASLVISGAGYKEAEVSVGSLNVIGTVLEKATGSFAEGAIVVTVGGMGFRDMDNYSTPARTKSIAIIKVKATETNKSIPNASVTISSSSQKETVQTDTRGEYKIKGIKKYQKYFIRVTAEGYEPNELTIDGSDFNDRKKEWEVLLGKQKVQPVKSAGLIMSATEKPIRLMGSFSFVDKDKGPLYVVDGIIMPNGENIKPHDIDDITVLQGPAAAALFGADGANGAIIITTRKLKQKTLDTVAINSVYGHGCPRKVTSTGGSISIVSEANYWLDKKASVKTLLTDSLKIYPNPVQRNTTFTISLKLEEIGSYQIQITDVSGRILSQKQINTLEKTYLEPMRPQAWSAGIYYLRVFNKEKLISKTSFIVE